MPIPAVRLNHAVLYVDNVTTAVDFYSTVLGMELVAHEPRMGAAFLRLPRSGNHHDLGLFTAPPSTQQRRSSPGLYHLAWQVDTIDDLIAARQTRIDHNAYVGESSHGATKSLYATDPAGNEFEVMWMLPRDQWDSYANSAPVEHLDLNSEHHAWSGVPTASELVPLPTQ